MELLVLILLILNVYLIYRTHKLGRIYSDQVILTAEYIRLVVLLMDENKNTEEDLKKQIWRSWLFDGNGNIRQFNRKWEVISRACNIPIVKNKYGVTSEVIENIAILLYTNRSLLKPIIKAYPSNYSLKDLESMDWSNKAYDNT